MPSTSFVFRVEQLNVTTPRSAVEDGFGCDADVVTIFVQVGDGAVYSFTIPVQDGVCNNSVVNLGRIAQTISIDCGSTLNVTTTYMVSNIAKPEPSFEDSYSQYLKAISQVSSAIASVGGFVGVPALGTIAKIVNGALQAVGLLGSGPPDCSGLVFSKMLPTYTPAELDTYTARWAAHRPPALDSDPITDTSCSTPSASISIAIEKVPPALTAVALSEGKIEVVFTTPNQAPQVRAFDVWDPPGTDSWEELGGAAIWSPCALCVTTDGITPPFISDLFLVGTDQNVYTKSRDHSGNWQPTWTQLGSPVGGSVVAVSPFPDRIDLFGIGRDDHTLYTCTRLDGQWTTWGQVTGRVLLPVTSPAELSGTGPFGSLAGNLAVVVKSGSPLQFDVFAVKVATSFPNYDPGRTLVHIRYDPTNGWVEDYGAYDVLSGCFRALGGDNLAATVNASATGQPSVVNLFTLGEDSKVYASCSAGSDIDAGWTGGGMYALGGPIVSRPVVFCALGKTENPDYRLYPPSPLYAVFGLGTDGQVYYTYWTEGQYAAGSGDKFSSCIGMPSAPTITAIGHPAVAFYPGNNRLFVFVVGSDERLYWKYLQCGTATTPDVAGGAWFPSQTGWLRDDAPNQPNPWRQFSVTIGEIQENFPVTYDQEGMVKTTAKVRIGTDGPLTDYTGSPIVRYYTDGTNSLTVHVEIWRTVTPKMISGRLEQVGGTWYVLWSDGTKDVFSSSAGSDPWTDLPHPPSAGMIVTKSVPEPASPGLARAFDLNVDYTRRFISGTIGSITIAGQAGQQIHVPGDASNPDVWLMIDVKETRDN